MTVKMSGVNQATNNLKRKAEQLKSQEAKSLDKSIALITKDSQTKVPVKTGKLKISSAAFVGNK